MPQWVSGMGWAEALRSGFESAVGFPWAPMSPTGRPGGVGEAGLGKMGWVGIFEVVGETWLGGKLQAVKKSVTAAQIISRKDRRVFIINSPWLVNL